MLFGGTMPTFMAGRHPLSPGNRAGIGAALVLLAIVSAVELAEGPYPRLVGLLAAVPFVAAIFAVWQLVLGAGVVATAVGALFVALTPSAAAAGLPPDHAAIQNLELAGLVNLMGVVLATGVAAGGATIRQRQADKIAELLRLAAVAQQAVLRPIGPQVGALAVAGRYISATAAADIGGDLCEALNTPYGVRIIIGDVRGKGLDAVRLASIVLGSYRHVAYERADLKSMVQDLDRAVARSVGDEDFVTAALVEERGGTLTIVNCGHPAPLLLRRGQVIPLEPPAPAPPLGFMPEVKARVERLEPGDRLLLFTDGLGEARRDGEFFPTADRAWRLLGHGTVGDGLASLETALVDWVHGRLEDDIALVLLEYAGPDGDAAVSVPSWEVGAAGS
ncbi:membrane protein [Actinoplanes philippinensis]|uniref:Stage II sporulation protein E (SpoIIE) n=1 Tax=Actinoplanes philippinensis TaxID=35752 RepID=A0A1I2KL96_9ACTN|nr:PP2C family protein-serine/threonine phosphatase [Actinoplanes philippinensis]GIE80988.1 membrane protein [Actinoplanes philippinensis]SFF67283.1 Stage II sporulation protein E (SpoIIE) [Actinoplanes philippinensis]